MIFVIGIMLFFFNHMNEKIYDGLDDYFEDSDFKNTTADQTLDKIHSVETRNTWDWAFLAIFSGIMISLLLFAFASRTNAAFYWIFVVLGIVILILGTVLSNIWQEMAENPEFSTTLTRFPATNAILGTYFPMIVVGFIFFTLVIMFGKRQNEV